MEYASLNFFVNALSSLFEFIFNDIFAPILEDILKVFMNFFFNVIWNLLSNYLVGLFSVLCALVDLIESIFNVFSGVAPVEVKYGAAYKQMTLIDALFDMDEVVWAFWVITFVSLVLCVIFTIYKTVKSISDMALEDRNPISKVLSEAMKAGLTFFLIPFLCVVMLQLSSAITEQVDIAFEEATEVDTTIGNILFLSATLEADRDSYNEKDLISGVITKKENAPAFQTISSGVREKYINDPTRYRDRDKVVEDFLPTNINYLVGFISAIVMILFLGLATISFVRRIFELLLLYIVSPFYVSTIPLDDGATFAKWRDLFVAKFFSGFGTVFSMKYYLMVVPMIADSKLQLFPMNSNLPGGSMINTVLQLFLIIGGAWAVFKGQSLILQLLSPEAAQQEQQTAALLTGAVFGGAAMALGAVTGNTKMMMSGAAKTKGAAGGGEGGQDSSAGSGGDSTQAYRGK